MLMPEEGIKVRRCIRRAAFVMLALLLWPACARGEGLDWGRVWADTQAGLERYVQALRLSGTRDLSLVLEADRLELQDGETATLEAVIENPYLWEQTVSLQLHLTEGCFQVEGDATQWTGALPAATLDEAGGIVPARVCMTWQLTALEAAGGEEGLRLADAIVTLSQDSRRYQSAQSLRLYSPRVSVQVHASTRTAHPEGEVLYTVLCANRGPASGSAQVRLALPEGLIPAELDMPGAARVEDGALVWEMQVPAAAYADGALLRPGYAVGVARVQVAADALDGVQSGRRLLTGEVTANGEALPPQRLTVSGPLLSLQVACDAERLAPGEEMTVALVLENAGAAPADVTLQAALPEGLRVARLVTRGLSGKIAGDTVSWKVHMDAAATGGDGQPIPAAERVEFVVQAQSLPGGERERLLGLFGTYRAGAQTPGISNVAQVSLETPTFLGATKSDWQAMLWAGVLLFATGLCLLLVVRREY